MVSVGLVVGVVGVGCRGLSGLSGCRARRGCRDVGVVSGFCQVFTSGRRAGAQQEDRQALSTVSTADLDARTSGIKGSQRQQPEAPTHRTSTFRGLDRAHPKGMVFDTSPYPNYIYYPTS